MGALVGARAVHPYGQWNIKISLGNFDILEACFYVVISFVELL